MRHGHWIFKKGTGLQLVQISEWVAFIECCEIRLARTRVGDGYVSTVFLGLDYNFSGGPLLLFETRIFCKEHEDIDGDGARYATPDEAFRGHNVMVERLREFYPEAVIAHEVFATGSLKPGQEERHAQIIQDLKQFDKS